jgi:apolipoprotein N-acyltransferase
MQKHHLSDRASGPQSTGVPTPDPDLAGIGFVFLTRSRRDGADRRSVAQGHGLMTGSVRPRRAAGPASPVAYNSISSTMTVRAVGTTLHLVPFGEYLPFQDWMEKLGFVQLTKVHGGFIPGARRRTMEIPDAPRALPLICYEAIFPGNVATRDDRPGWIVNLTNDGWFGNSTGPISTCRRGCVRSRKGCRWCAPPIPASRR